MTIFAKKHGGFSIGSVIVFIAIMGFGGIIGAKCIPPWLEFSAAKKAVKAIEENAGMTPSEARKAFDRAAEIDRIEAIKGSDVEFVANGKGVKGTFEYEARVSLVGNTSLVFTFAKK